MNDDRLGRTSNIEYNKDRETQALPWLHLRTGHGVINCRSGTRTATPCLHGDALPLDCCSPLQLCFFTACCGGGVLTSHGGWNSTISSRLLIRKRQRAAAVQGNDGKFTYNYDAEGNRTSKTDNASGSKVEYTWNHANLLTAVVYKTSNQVVTKSVAYQYDALGRRIAKNVDDNGNGTVNRRESYIYDGVGLLSSFSTGIGGEGARRADEGAAILISGPNGVIDQHGWVDQMVLSFIDADGDGPGAMTLASRNLYGDAVDQIFATESGSGLSYRTPGQL